MHTQGTLKVIEADEYCGPYLTDEIGETVADLYYMYRPNTPHRFANCEDNARRLVACWNVCEGIETEALESGLLRQILVELRRQSEAARGEVTK